jgi:hypothetical protein
MRSKRTWQAEPDEEEADLPGDLSTLAEQLTDDAENLAERYPAKMAEPMPQVSSRGKVIRRIAAAAILIAIGSGATVVALRPWMPADVAKVETLAEKSAPEKNAAVVKRESDQSTRPAESRSVEVREVAFNPPAATGSNLSELQMLRIQVTAFEQVIHRLQDELARRDKSQAETDKLVQELRQEVEQLRQRLDADHKQDVAK